jgi:hypothetical protein
MNRPTSWKPAGVVRVESLFPVADFRNAAGTLRSGPLMRQPPADREEALAARARALENTLVAGNLLSRDGTTTSVNVFVEPDPDDPQFYDTLAAAIEKLLEPCQGRFEEAFQLGNPYFRTVISQTMIHDQMRLVPLSVAVLILPLVLMTRSPASAILPLLTAGRASAGWASCPARPSRRTSCHLVPSLGIVIGSTEDIHLISEYREGLHKRGPGKLAFDYMVSKMGVVILITSLTTFLGFASITVNKIEILRQFGMAAAFGLLVNPVITVALIPAYLRLTGGRGASPQAPAGPARPDDDEDAEPQPWKKSPEPLRRARPRRHARRQPPRPQARGRAAAVRRGHFPVRGQRAAEQRHPGRVQEILAHPPAHRGHGRTPARRADLLHRRGQRRGGHARSPTPCAPWRPSRTTSPQPGLRHVLLPGRFPAAHQPRDARRRPGLLHHPRHRGPGRPVPAVHPRLGPAPQREPRLQPVPHPGPPQPAIVHDQKRLAGPALLMDQTLGPHYTSDFTGESMLILGGADSIAEGQALSIALLLGIIFLIMSVLFVNMKAGLLSLLPNIFPVLIMFGTMGILGIPLNIGTAMVAAIASSSPRTDTIHFMTRYNKEMLRLKDQHRRPWRSAFHARNPAGDGPSPGLASGLLGVLALEFVTSSIRGPVSAWDDAALAGDCCSRAAADQRSP